MKYEDFEKFIKEKCMYDTIYDDSDGRPILIIRMLDAYGMLNKAPREWVGLTDEEILEEYRQSYGDDGDLTDVYFARAIEAKLKEKNT